MAGGALCSICRGPEGLAIKHVRVLNMGGGLGKALSGHAFVRRWSKALCHERPGI